MLLDRSRALEAQLNALSDDQLKRFYSLTDAYSDKLADELEKVTRHEEEINRLLLNTKAKLRN